MSDVVIGIDPDTKTTAVAVTTKHKLLAVMMIRPAKREESDSPAVAMVRAVYNALPKIAEFVHQRKALFVIEGQQIRHGSSAPPADILQLALVAGACVLAASSFGVPILVPLPHDWKGNTPKPINQMRTFRALGLPAEQRSEYCVPLETPDLLRVQGYQDVTISDWKHLGDAAGLALWGARR